MIKSILQLFSLLKGLFALYRKAKREGWLQDGKELAFKIGKAKTDKQRRALILKLSKHYKRM